jgi:hypothetical protein
VGHRHCFIAIFQLVRLDLAVLVWGRASAAMAVQSGLNDEYVAVMQQNTRIVEARMFPTKGMTSSHHEQLSLGVGHHCLELRARGGRKHLFVGVASASHGVRKHMFVESDRVSEARGRNML